VKAEPRTTGKTVEAMMAAEAARIEAALPPRCRRLILDERGEDLTTKALAKRLERWQDGGDDVAIIIGGPDGLDPALKATAHDDAPLQPHPAPRHGPVMLAEGPLPGLERAQEPPLPPGVTGGREADTGRPPGGVWHPSGWSGTGFA
jgi:hypothetical protein